MHVVIVGAGEVGWFLSERLGAEGHDVVVVEKEASLATKVADSLDVAVVVGSGTNPAILRSAGTERAGLIAAVTDNDEVNLIISALGAEMGAATRVVRLQQSSMRGEEAAGLRSLVGTSIVMDPDSDTADEIAELLQTTGASEIHMMAGGTFALVGATMAPDAPFTGMSLAEIAKEHEPNWDFLFGAVTRDGRTTIPRGDQTLQAGDHVRVLCRRSARSRILGLLGVDGKVARRVMILGGGAIGSQLARRLRQDGVEIVLVERDQETAQHLSETLHRVSIIHGDITDPQLLSQEDIGNMDAVVATTGEDASNILACAYASSEGTAYTVAVLHRLELLPLVRQFAIDAALSPRTASANSVLKLVRGDHDVATFLGSDLEVDELEVQAKSRVCGRAVEDIHFSRDMLLAAVVRPDGDDEIVRGSTVLRPGDDVIIFARSEALFQAREAFTGQP